MSDQKTVKLIAGRLGSRRFDIVIILIGDNDVVENKGDSGLLAARIWAIASWWRVRAQANAVYVCGVVPRFPRSDGRLGRYPFVADYNRWALELNSELKKGAGAKGSFFWRHNFLVCSDNAADLESKCKKYIAGDGVHLNDKGHFLLYKSLQRLLAGHSRRQKTAVEVGFSYV